MMADLAEQARQYLQQMPPHVASRKSAKLMAELVTEVERLQVVIDDRDAELGHKLSVIAHDGVRKNGQMRHDIGLLLMTAVREATEAEDES